MENRFFFQAIDPTVFLFPLPLLLLAPTPSLSVIPTPSFPFRKEQDSKIQQPNTTKQDTVRQGKSPHIKDEQVKEEEKSPEGHLLPL